MSNKRTFLGPIFDILKSCKRHYRNTYTDGYIQDCLLLTSGLYIPSKAPPNTVPPSKPMLLGLMVSSESFFFFSLLT